MVCDVLNYMNFYVTLTIGNHKIADVVLTYRTKAQYITANIEIANNVTVCGL